jgi:hypothetical protein
MLSRPKPPPIRAPPPRSSSTSELVSQFHGCLPPLRPLPRLRKPMFPNPPDDG